MFKCAAHEKLTGCCVRNINYLYQVFRPVDFYRYHIQRYEVLPTYMSNLTSVCPFIVSVIVNDDQQDATILAYLFIPNQL